MIIVKKSFIVCFLLAFVSVVWAKEGFALPSEKQEDQIIDLAYVTMMETIERLDKKIDECRVLRRENILSSTLLQSLPLNKQEIREVVLPRFHFLSLTKCEGEDLWAKASIEFAQFKYIEKYYKGKNVIDTGYYSFELICCMGSHYNVEVELKYRKLPLETREKLERIPALQKPFNFITSAEKMGLLETIEK
ncbi:MAG: hypothetical protein L3K24_12490 [Gammaproteobacteria bacterium]|nr:hypothetical protein [Gammaproteobacteria bacterium]